MNVLCKIILVVSIVVFFGTFGAVDLNNISLVQGMVQFIASGITAFVSGYMLHMLNERESNDVHDIDV